MTTLSPKSSKSSKRMQINVTIPAVVTQSKEFFSASSWNQLNLKPPEIKKLSIDRHTLPQ
eukprot:Pgem_evm1s1589